MFLIFAQCCLALVQPRPGREKQWHVRVLCESTPASCSPFLPQKQMPLGTTACMYIFYKYSILVLAMTAVLPVWSVAQYTGGGGCFTNIKSPVVT